MLANVLNLLLPAAVIAYAAFVIAHLRKSRGCSGCTGCSMAGKCRQKGKKP